MLKSPVWHLLCLSQSHRFVRHVYWQHEMKKQSIMRHVVHLRFTAVFYQLLKIWLHKRLFWVQVRVNIDFSFRLFLKCLSRPGPTTSLRIHFHLFFTPLGPSLDTHTSILKERCFVYTVWIIVDGICHLLKIENYGMFLWNLYRIQLPLS